jgi:anti-sigma factor RsiW
MSARIGCREVGDRVAAYLDAQLAPAERELFEEHLFACEGCRALVERVGEQDFSVADPPPPPSAEAWERMDRRLHDEIAAVAARPARGFVVSRRAALAYAAAFLLAIAWGAYNHLLARDAHDRLSEIEQVTLVETLETPPGERPMRLSSELGLATYTPHRSTF